MVERSDTTGHVAKARSHPRGMPEFFLIVEFEMIRGLVLVVCNPSGIVLFVIGSCSGGIAALNRPANHCCPSGTDCGRWLVSSQPPANHCCPSGAIISVDSCIHDNDEINDPLHERYANIRITSSTSTVNGAFPVISPSRFSLSFPCEWSANERT